MPSRLELPLHHRPVLMSYWSLFFHGLSSVARRLLRIGRSAAPDNLQQSRGDQISIPHKLTRLHGGTPQEARQIGHKWAETFEVIGGLRAGHSILDIGCGPGRMAIAIGERFDWHNSYTGFEINDQDVRFCRENISTTHPSFEFIHMDVYNVEYNSAGTIGITDVEFPAEAGSIDFCFATSVFTHLFGEEARHYIREASRVTRGTFLSTWFILDDEFAEAEQAGTTRFTFPYSRGDGTRFEHANAIAAAVGHSWDAVQDLFREAGLSCELHRGAWRGNKKASRHSQDIIVARPL